MQQRFTHIALTVPRQQFNEQFLHDVRDFYKAVFGWTENAGLAIAKERLVLDVLGRGQYLNVRASDEPMTTTGYEHFGFSVLEPEDMRELHRRAASYAQKDSRVQVGALTVSPDGTYHAFRVSYLLPMTMEVQCFLNEPGI